MDEVFRPYLLCSENIGKSDEDFLKKIFTLVKLPPFSALSSCVASHADMLFFADAGRLLTHRGYIEENRSLFAKSKLIDKMTAIDESASEKYPNDILLSGLFLSGRLYGRTDKLSRSLTEMCSEHVFVRQGYARCSVCKLKENAIITADKGIASAARDNGVDVLQISEGNILLEGCSYGFIGGASFTCSDTVFFFGRIEDHPDFEKMSAFAKKHSVKLVSTSDSPLHDIGGAVIYE